MIEQAALNKGYVIAAKIGPNCFDKIISEKSIVDADVCIDFTHPESALENIKKSATLGKNIVVGTTGWYDGLDEARKIVMENGVGLLYSPNFSLGVALFLEIISEAAALIAPFQTYDVGGFEIHHSQKADSPSGTARAIADRLLSKIPSKKKAQFTLREGLGKQDELHFASARFGYNPGTHSVIFDSPADTITLTHAARNREGFAEGALKAAEWLQNKKGFYTLDNMLFS